MDLFREGKIDHLMSGMAMKENIINRDKND